MIRIRVRSAAVGALMRASPLMPAIVAGYGFFAQTGRYEAGATDNAGFGMWSHGIHGGLTACLDEGKKVSLLTTAFFEMHSNKKDQDLKVGNRLTLEGGAASNVPALGAAFGVGYYLQNKVSDDGGSDVPEALLRAHPARALTLAGIRA